MKRERCCLQGPAALWTTQPGLSPPSFWGAPINLMSHLLVSGPTFCPSLTNTSGSMCSDAQQAQVTLVQPWRGSAAPPLVGSSFSCSGRPVSQPPSAGPPSAAGSLMLGMERKRRSSSSPAPVLLPSPGLQHQHQEQHQHQDQDQHQDLPSHPRLIQALHLHFHLQSGVFEQFFQV